MINKISIKEKLTRVIYPGFTKSIVEFGFVKEIIVDGNKVTVNMDIPSASIEIEKQLRKEIKKESLF